MLILISVSLFPQKRIRFTTLELYSRSFRRLIRPVSTHPPLVGSCYMYVWNARLLHDVTRSLELLRTGEHWFSVYINKDTHIISAAKLFINIVFIWLLFTKSTTLLKKFSISMFDNEIIEIYPHLYCRDMYHYMNY